ncbi:hypothetical protein [Yoonia rosea]|uniref:hypothetical protein n=1 Tax=Yoonia rosea TaxID=287098 RepID=UPI00105553DF|nr:hypothetical protein [Yoonia rosea]
MYYIIFLLAWIFGVTRRGDNSAKSKRVGFRVTTASLLAAVAFFVLISGIQMGGLIFAAIPLFILFPALAFGIGLAVSTIANDLASKNRTISAFAMGAISVIGPSFAILLFWWSQNTHEEQRQDDLAAFQAGDIVGQIGDQRVRFPASPQLETIHTCESYQRCYTKFLRSGDTLQDLAGFGAEEVVLMEIELIPVHRTCDGPTAPLNACLRQSKLQAWCETRAAFSESVWCQGKPRHRVVFSPMIEGNLQRFQDNNWLNAGEENLGMDYLGAPIEIECNTRRDESILSNPHFSRYCRLKFSVAAKVSATIFLDRFEPTEMKSQATTMLDYANAIWASVSQQ